MGNSPSDEIGLWEPEEEEGLAAFFDIHLVSFILSYSLPSLVISRNNLVQAMQQKDLLKVMPREWGDLVYRKFEVAKTFEHMDIPESGLRVFLTHDCTNSCPGKIRHVIEVGETCTLVLKHHSWQETFFIVIKRVIWSRCFWSLCMIADDGQPRCYQVIRLLSTQKNF